MTEEGPDSDRRSLESEVTGVPIGPWAGALGLTLLVGIFPQFAIGALGPQLRVDLALEAADLGLIFAGFIGLGLVGSPLAGPIADRIGGRRSCLGLLLVSGAALLVASFATSMAGLVLALLPAGAAMAFANPGTNRWASAAADTRTQATLVGVAQAGVQAGALLAGALAAASVLGLDWRNAFRVGALLALCGAAAAWRGPRDVGSSAARPRPRTVTTASLGTAGGAGPGLSVDARRDLLALATYATFMGGGTALVFAYLPSFAVDAAGLSIAAAGATTMIFGGTALLCRLGLGAIIRRPDQVGPPLLIAMAIGSAVSIGLIAAGAVSPAWIWVGAVAFGATGTTWPVVAFLAVVRASPPGGAGRVTGWVTAAFYAGLLITPPIGGQVITAVGYRWLWVGAASCYLLATLPVLRRPAA
ncbi:MFS transporter [Nitriliruptor alkaliphilus]|uniref:MFS transporter n=1 Tax=Nitriliruptor alkaliphilus TaxID=427918 RepID=UPI000697FF4D|nr:MFS transporter [Nitriliruptor alkaliphilus]